jgi:hypothetical protein
MCKLKFSISTPPGLIGAQQDLPAIVLTAHRLQVSDDRLEAFEHLNSYLSMKTLMGISTDVPNEKIEALVSWYKQDLHLEGIPLKTASLCFLI